MKKTFTTAMPDEEGAFWAIGRIFGDLSLNITRVSYNRAVGAHMLFIGAEGAGMRRARLFTLMTCVDTAPALAAQERKARGPFRQPGMACVRRPRPLSCD